MIWYPSTYIIKKYINLPIAVKTTRFWSFSYLLPSRQRGFEVLLEKRISIPSWRTPAKANSDKDILKNITTLGPRKSWFQANLGFAPSYQQYYMLILGCRLLLYFNINVYIYFNWNKSNYFHTIQVWDFSRELIKVFARYV